MHRHEAYSLAHTARCKLQLAANRPDRNLRFILGHAFTLDKLNLRLAEIEVDDSYEEDPSDQLSGSRDGAGERFCVLPEDLDAGARTKEGRQSSGPRAVVNSKNYDMDGEEDEEAEDDGLSLQRFGTNSARPPQMVDDDSASSSSSSDEEEYDFDFSSIMPSHDEMRQVTAGPDDSDLKNLYHNVAKCPCHGKSGDDVEHVWKIPQKEGQPQLAIVQVTAQA